MVRAAAGAVESVRRVKGLGPTARRHGRAARSDGHPPSSREPADRLPAWRMVWHVGAMGMGRTVRVHHFAAPQSNDL